MASVTGYTAAKMEELADANIVDGEVVGDDLILTRRNLTQINAGNVRGATGPTGPAAAFLSDIGDVDEAAAATNDGLVWTGTEWAPAKKTTKVAWTYTLPGEIKVPAGATDYLPPALISLITNQTVTLVGYQWFLSSGTSFTFKISHWRAGTTTDLVTDVVAASATGRGTAAFGTPKVFNDLDEWMPVITAVSGTPSGGYVAMLAEVMS
jgi:hypothetical protein